MEYDYVVLMVSPLHRRKQWKRLQLDKSWRHKQHPVLIIYILHSSVVFFSLGCSGLNGKVVKNGNLFTMQIANLHPSLLVLVEGFNVKLSVQYDFPPTRK